MHDSRGRPEEGESEEGEEVRTHVTTQCVVASTASGVPSTEAHRVVRSSRGGARDTSQRGTVTRRGGTSAG